MSNIGHLVGRRSPNRIVEEVHHVHKFRRTLEANERRKKELVEWYAVVNLGDMSEKEHQYGGQMRSVYTEDVIEIR